MSYLIQAWLDLFAAQGAVGIVKVVVMWVLGGVLIFLAIKKDMEPALLLPIGFGAILVNIPGTSVLTDGDGTGIISWLYEVGIEASEAMPILLFIGIGAMIDFEPLTQALSVPPQEGGPGQTDIWKKGRKCFLRCLV